MTLTDDDKERAPTTGAQARWMTPIGYKSAIDDQVWDRLDEALKDR